MDKIQKIKELKKEKDVVILAHYYVDGQVQELADHVGDSFALSKLATTVKNQNILFCGVKFMGESAKILNPKKTVIMPDITADCPMAHMVEIEKIRQVREMFPDVAVVCYVNSTAEIKSYSDVCVTSSNAIKVVKALPNKDIFFIPDNNLAAYVAKQVPEKHFIFNDGYCPVHQMMKTEEIRQAKAMHPGAEVLSHPECTKAVLDLSDYAGSTSGIIRYAGESSAREFIICTENGVLAELQKRYPEKKFFFTKTVPVCEDMKLITPEKILHVLKTGENEVVMDAETCEASRKPLEEMLRLAK